MITKIDRTEMPLKKISNLISSGNGSLLNRKARGFLKSVRCLHSKAVTGFSHKTMIKDLLYPFDAAVFFRSYWDKKPVLIRGRNERRLSKCENLFSLSKLEGGLKKNVFPVEKLQFFNAEALPDDNGQFLKNRMLPGKERWIFSKIIDYVKKKSGSFLVNALQNYDLDVHQFTQRLASALAGGASCNAYITGAGGKAFRVHWDTHDVFVLQIVGSKKWTIYKPMIERPLFDFHQPHLFKVEAGKPLASGILQKGELLYIPRGFLHEADGTDELSVHLTFSYYHPTWYDWFKVAIENTLAHFAEDPKMRATCPQLLISARKQRMMNEIYASIRSQLRDHISRMKHKPLLENRFLSRHKLV